MAIFRRFEDDYTGVLPPPDFQISIYAAAFAFSDIASA